MVLSASGNILTISYRQLSRLTPSQRLELCGPTGYASLGSLYIAD